MVERPVLADNSAKWRVIERMHWRSLRASMRKMAHGTNINIEAAAARLIHRINEDNRVSM
jgi:hypothetical protein